ncbi:uncharacterized protein LOC119776771 [Cyprinodon tularosa]|uniref:uncharacterized protein LOC119776771 n=1 Tax=Cyprinodon tularosa TaxID=77115 RepID=UPI0018E28AA8|nr:uncharacterized protein LOC119776771 [Cyprinodon tularosa]
MMETDPDLAPSLHLGHTDIRPSDTDRSLRRGYREQLKKNALQATETGLHQADEILQRQDEVTHEATENPNQQQTDTQKAAENVGRPNTKDDTEGGRQEGQTECNLCVLRCAEMNRLLEENRELRRELDELRISDCFFGDTNEKVQYYTGRHQQRYTIRQEGKMEQQDAALDEDMSKFTLQPSGWITDFLSDRKQQVKLGNDVSSSQLLRAVLSPLLVSLNTRSCTSSHQSLKRLKFMDAAALMGHISDGDAYRWTLTIW